MLCNIKGIIFDMDGTLIDSMWVWKQVDIDYLNKRGINLPSDLQKSIEGLSFTETASYFKKRFCINESIEEIKNEWSEMVYEHYNSIIKVKNGVKEFLLYLKKNNYKIGIATSNYLELANLVLKSNGIFNFFDIIVTTCEVKHDKSFPDVFIETAKRLGVKPSECLVFEDTISAIKGATDAGMKVIGVYDSYGTYTIDELSKVTDNIIYDFESILNICIKNNSYSI